MKYDGLIPLGHPIGDSIKVEPPTLTYERMFEELCLEVWKVLPGISLAEGSVTRGLLSAMARAVVAQFEAFARPIKIAEPPDDRPRLEMLRACCGLVSRPAGIATTANAPPVKPPLPKIGERVKRVYRDCTIYGSVEEIDNDDLKLRIDNIEGSSISSVGDARRIPIAHWYDSNGGPSRVGLFYADFDSAGEHTEPVVNGIDFETPACTNCKTCGERFEYGPLVANRPDGFRDCGRCAAMNKVFK